MCPISPSDQCLLDVSQFQHQSFSINIHSHNVAPYILLQGSCIKMCQMKTLRSQTSSISISSRQQATALKSASESHHLSCQIHAHQLEIRSCFCLLLCGIKELMFQQLLPILMLSLPPLYKLCANVKLDRHSNGNQERGHQIVAGLLKVSERATFSRDLAGDYLPPLNDFMTTVFSAALLSGEKSKP